jgi:putative inorganic carbon (HCO3(-)) transporter
VAAPTPEEPQTSGRGLARRTAWWSLLAMVFLVPLVMSDFAVPGLADRLAFSELQLVKLSLILILALVTLAAWATDLLRHGGHIRRTPVDWLILAWLLWVGATTVTSVHWPTAFLGAQGRYEGLVTFVVYALVYFLALQFADEEGRVLRLAKTLFWSSMIVAVYGLLQYAGVVSLPEDLPWNETSRAFSTYGNPNMLGGFLIFPVTVALGLALQESRVAWRLVYWVGFGLNGLALLVTFTRGAWIGGAVSLILLGLIAWRQRTKMARVDWAPAGVFGAAGIALLVRSLFSAGEVTNFAKRIASIFDFGSGSGQTRTEIWQAAARAIKDRPLFGWGPDTFGLIFPKFKPAEYVRDAGGASGSDNAHDYPLHLASGLGILGPVLFYALWVWAGIRSWKIVFGRPGNSARLLVGAFWAAAAGYLLHLVFGISVPGSTFLLWIALAVVLAPTARSVPVPARRLGTVTAVSIALLAALGIAGQGVVLAADRAYTLASEDFSQHTLSERSAAADQAVRLNPLVPRYRSTVGALAWERMAAEAAALAHALEQGEDPAPYRAALAQSLAGAVSAYEDAIAFTPYDYANYVNLAVVYNFAGAKLDPKDYLNAIDAAERGLRLAPLGTDAREQLAEALVATGQTDEAMETLRYCVQLDPADGSAALALAKLYQERGRAGEALALLSSVEARAPGQPGVAAMIKALQEQPSLP